MKKFLIPMLIATTTAAPLMATVSCAPKEAESFINDSWKTVCYYAKKGLDKLHEAYKADCNANTDFPGTLIGLTRKVTINGLEHTVRVVGEEQDYLDEKHEKPVTLTFQFNNLVSGSDKKILATFWQNDNQKEGCHYWNSRLNDVLNSSDDVEWWDGDNGHVVSENRSVYQMIKDENKDLAKNIKSVNKTFNVDPSESKNWVAVSQSTKLFCPAIANYYDKDVKPWKESGSPSKQYQCEGSQYQYYVKKVGKKTTGPGHENNAVVFTDIAGNKYNYWITSPSLTANEPYFAIKEPGEQTIQEGSLLYQASHHKYPVVPCFCI